MKKTALFLSCLLALTACSEKESAEAPAAPEAATEAVSTQSTSAPTAGTTTNAENYIVGTDATFPPFDFKDENGQVIGFDVDVLRAIGEKQNFNVTFVSANRSQLFDNLKKGDYQLLAACLGMSPERLANSEMSKPYVFAPNVIMGKDNNAKTLADLVGKKVGVQEGSYQLEELKKAQVPNIREDKSTFNAYSALMRGEVDYVVGDAGVLSYLHKGNTDANKPQVFTSIYDKDADVRVAFAAAKGNTDLINKINEGLQQIKDDGTYDKIYTKWFGDDNSLRVAEK